MKGSGEAKSVAIYERVSSEEQKTKETIATQDEFLGEFVALYGLEVVKVYKDEAISGTVPLGERPAGSELLSDAAGGLFDAVLVYRLDRIGRTLLVVVDAHDRLEQAGVALKSATEPIDTSTPPGRLIFQMLASFSEFERETINERTRDGKNRAYRAGAQPGLIPYGYDIDDSGAFVVVEDEARVVEQVIGNVAAGATLFAEAKRLNLEGVPSPGKKYRGKTRRTGTTWSPTAISRLVGRRAYGGTHVIRSSAGEIEREVPPIVAEDLRLAAAARLTDNKRFGGGRPVRPYLLRGLIKCEECAWNYCGVSRKAKDGYRFRYACPVSSARRFDPSAVRRGCPTIDALWLEDLVWEDIRRFVSDPGEALARPRTKRTRTARGRGARHRRAAGRPQAPPARRARREGSIRQALRRRAPGRRGTRHLPPRPEEPHDQPGHAHRRSPGAKDRGGARRPHHARYGGVARLPARRPQRPRRGHRRGARGTPRASLPARRANKRGARRSTGGGQAPRAHRLPLRRAGQTRRHVGW